MDTPRDVDVELKNGGITVVPWSVTINIKKGQPGYPDFIKWHGKGCRIKIEPDHPDHFSPPLPEKYKGTVDGCIDEKVPNGTYKYRVSVLERKANDAAEDDDVAVYSVDPDYKVDR